MLNCVWHEEMRYNRVKIHIAIHKIHRQLQSIGAFYIINSYITWFN